MSSQQVKLKIEVGLFQEGALDIVAGIGETALDTVRGVGSMGPVAGH